MFCFFPYSIPLAHSYRWARGVQRWRSGLWVRYDGARGNVGWGETAPPPDAATDLRALATQARELVQGLDGLSEDFVASLDARAPSPRLRCGVVTAALAAQAQAASCSLGELLAAKRGRTAAQRVPLNALITAPEPEAVATEVAASAKRGFTVVKLKLGAAPKRDYARVAAAVRAAPSLRFRLDPNASWGSLERALSELEAYADFPIDYVEQPLPAGLPWSLYAELQRRSPVDLFLDESVGSLADVRQAAQSAAARGLVLKPQRLGGIDRALEAADLGRNLGLRVTWTASLETSVGLMATAEGLSASALPHAPAGLATAHYFAAQPLPMPRLERAWLPLPHGGRASVGS